jgi:hypothetical protein
MLKKECKNPFVRRNKEKNLMIMGKYFYLKTCRRKFVLEHFDQIPAFFNCDKCDNCCQKDLVDVTDIIWQLKNYTPQIEKENLSNLYFQNIKQNLIAQELIKIIKYKVIFNNGLANWVKYVDHKGYNEETLPKKLHVKIPIQQLYNTKEEDDFDKCEKILDKFTKIKNKKN